MSGVHLSFPQLLPRPEGPHATRVQTSGALSPHLPPLLVLRVSPAAKARRPPYRSALPPARRVAARCQVRRVWQRGDVLRAVQLLSLRRTPAQTPTQILLRAAETDPNSRALAGGRTTTVQEGLLRYSSAGSPSRERAFRGLSRPL